MASTLDLFDPPAHRGSLTSQLAAASILPTVSTKRQLVLDYVRDHERGVIRDDVVEGLGMLTQTACARLNELQHAGLLTVTDERRPSATGRAAQVYVAA